MNKPEKYIHITDYKTSEVETRLNPKYIEYLEMLAEKYEEIKPREFEEGAFYPVTLKNRDHCVLPYHNGTFTGDTYEIYEVEDFVWIGEQLNIDWPNTIQDHIMNKHIKLVKKWLADNNSVSLEELEANKKSAHAAYDAAARSAAHAAHAAAWADHAVDNAAHSVERYEELINE